MFAVFKKSNKRKKFLSFYQKSKQIEVSLCSNAKRKYLHIVQLQAIFFANFFFLILLISLISTMKPFHSRWNIYVPFNLDITLTSETVIKNFINSRRIFARRKEKAEREKMNMYDLPYSTRAQFKECIYIH